MSRRRSRQAYLIELYQLIADRFDEQKLADLYDELAVEAHVLPGQGKKSARVRELVIYLEQQGRIPALLEKCRQIEPDFDWPDGSAKSKVTEQQEAYTRSAGTGLTLLAELVAAPSIHNAVSNFQKDFEAARNKIEMVSHYKDLHDLFQEMETSYNLLQNDRERLPEDETAWDSLMVNQFLLQDAIDDLLSAAEQPPYVAHAGYWLQLLRKGQATLQAAIEENDLNKLDTALRLLYRSLDRGLPRVNGRLVDAAIDLPLENLVAAMTAVQETLQSQYGLDSQTVEQFAVSVKALAELADDLDRLVVHHNAWQWMDDELRRVEANLGADIFELELTWPELREMAHELYGDSNESWAVSLKRIGDHLEAALTTRPPAVVNDIFQSYRSQASRRFRQVDDDLLQLCQNLQKIDAPLDMLLRTIK